MTTYISLDIETDGPIIGINSMLSLGAAAFSFDYYDGSKELGTFEINLEPILGAVQDKSTMEEFWALHPEQFEYATSNQNDCVYAMTQFNMWVKQLPKPILAAAYPDSFDFAWVRYYLLRFAGEDTLGYESLDIKSLACGLLKRPFVGIKTSNLPEKWRDRESRVAHRAIDDALQQGTMLMNMLREANIK